MKFGWRIGLSIRKTNYSRDMTICTSGDTRLTRIVAQLYLTAVTTSIDLHIRLMWSSIFRRVNDRIYTSKFQSTTLAPKFSPISWRGNFRPIRVNSNHIGTDVSPAEIQSVPCKNHFIQQSQSVSLRWLRWAWDHQLGKPCWTPVLSW